MKFPKILASASLISLFFTNTAWASFNDVQDTHPNYKGISYLELQGAIDNSNDFRPDESINKAEFFKILFTLFEEDPQNVTQSIKFMDVNSNAWFAPYTELAVQYDIINSNTPYFHPESGISRANAVKYLMKAYGIPTPIVPISERKPLFYDVNEYNPKYSIIKKACDYGILDENPNKTFRPYANITRGEFADLLFSFDQWNTEISGISFDNISEIHKSEILADIWTRIVSNYYLPAGSEIDEEVLFQSAVKGLVESLNDPYSVYIPPTDSDAYVTQLTGNFEGIGIYMLQEETSGKFIISDFVPNSHAQEVGILVGDTIEEVDGINVAGMSIEEVTNRIKGTAGTSVKLTIRRNGTPHTYVVERRALELLTEEGYILNDDIWYIDINVFTDDVFIGVNTLINELKAQVPEPRAIFIDLRRNGGGFINSSFRVMEHFLPPKAPMVQLDYGSFTTVTNNPGDGEYASYPIYVFVDEYTASASEIMAAALKEQSNAILIGKTTFGKGTAQQITRYWDGSILKITIAQWLSSNGTIIQGKGIEPNIKITMESSTLDLWVEKALQDLNER
ncbi:S-layer homology domain-containing protein [Patescibacteria group bacterium]|nr:S-layer homology domain-containing protein [Patescibacteria group bacterium]